MPRGFLVKRYSKTSPPPLSSPSTALPSSSSSQRVRRYSDEDRSDTSSDHELLDHSDLLRHSLFCPPGPPPLRTSVPTKDSDQDTPSPPYVEYNNNLCQEVPLALTKEKILFSPTTDRIKNHTFHPFRNPLVYFPRQNGPHLPSTPPPLKSKFATIHPHSAPTATITSKSQEKLTTPKTNSCQPPKKRSADANASEAKSKAAKRSKVVRKLNFDEDKSSPVSGTFIRDTDDDDEVMSSHSSAIRKGDIDSSLNVVVITEEARAELAKIENKIGDYVCQLCKEQYDDAFGLAQHRCPKIVHIEYRCPECDKVFNCPANLASHRRWHKPRPPPGTKNSTASNPPKLISSNVSKKEHKVLSSDNLIRPINKTRDSFSTDPSDTESIRDTPPPEMSTINRFNSQNDDKSFECHLCSKKFSQYFYFRKHLLSHLTTNANGQLESELIQSVFSKGASEKRTALARLNITPPPENEKDRSGFTCTICGLLFQTKSEMEQHTFKHDELKGIPCKYCPSTFYSSAGLTRHINKHHPSENRHVLLQVPTVRPLST